MARKSRSGPATILINNQNLEINRLRKRLTETNHRLRSLKATNNDLAHMLAIERSQNRGAAQ